MGKYVDFYYGSLNKRDEELCGDRVEYHRNGDGIISVLSDGLGSGVKANILATLTSKIAIKMLKEGAELDEVVETIASTLPVCNIRKLAYSTFSIAKISNNGKAYIAEFDTPSIFFIRDGRVLKLDGEIKEINNKKVKEIECKIENGDLLIQVSDGAIHAGAEATLNFGWQWDNIADYLTANYDRNISAKKIGTKLLGACNDLYMGRPGDDTTVAVLKITAPKYTTIFSGPPENTNFDKIVVKRLIESEGNKVVCGGTAANIVARETGNRIETDFNIFDMRVPPIGRIKEIDLVTEGVLTMKTAIDKIEDILINGGYGYENLRDGASKLVKILLDDSTHIKFLVGRAINSAHQNPYFPQELSIKLNVINELREILERAGKIAEIEYFE